MTKVTVNKNRVSCADFTPSSGQSIQFDDEGVSLGFPTEVDFVGAGVTGTISGSKITYNIPAGGGGAVSSVSGTANQITSSPTTGAVVLSLPSNVIFPGTWQIGALNYTDTGILWSSQSTVAGYNQVVVQNTNNGNTASANYIVSNDVGTASTFFGEFGMNSSTFAGSGSFNLPSAVYLDAMSSDLVIGTLANKSIHFVTNNSTTDSMSISGSGNFAFTQAAQSSGWGKALLFTPGAHTAYTTATEFIDYDFVGRNVTWIDGTTATQRFAYFRGNTVNKTTTSATFTDIYTTFTDPSIITAGVTFTRNWAAGFGGHVQVKGDLKLMAGATANIGTFDPNILQIVSNSGVRATISTAGTWVFSNTSTTGNATFITFTDSSAVSGIHNGFIWTGGTHTNQTLNTEITDINYNLSAVLKMADGTVATQRAFRIQGRTYTPQTSALTLTEVSTLEVTAPTAGSGTTFTNSDAWAIRCTGNFKVTGTRLNAASLPTSSAGLASGDMWKNGNVVNIV